jgi:hypothetical protein
VLVSASLLSGCGSGSAKPAPGMGCALNSDCAAGLTCTFGLCHAACVVNGDCPTGELCVKSDAVAGDAGSVDAATVNVCQLPKELKCVYNSNCMAPLICARDQECRNQCQMDVDCVSPQVCTTSKVCALTSQLAPGTNDVPVVTTGVGGAAGSGATGTGGTTTGTGGASATGGTTGTGGAGGASATGGTTGTGGAKGTGGAGGSTGACSPACGPGYECVSGSCQACGTAGSVCCGTAATCNSNLTCVSGMCTCGSATEACCNGTTCTAGLACVAGVCTCGGAGQSCCTGKTCTGSFICGGLSCGCEQACDGYAVQKIDGSIVVEGTPVTNTDASAFKATSFAYGGQVSCGVKADSSVWCWGSNTYGALGLGNSAVTTSTTPVQVMYMSAGSLVPLTGITKVATADSGYTACAIGAQGALWCWGYGASGQLGNGLKANYGYAVPVTDATSTAIVGASDVAVANSHACMLKTDMTVWCWGDNTYGQIGNGSVPSSSTPVLNPSQVSNLGVSATSIAVTDYEYGISCASTADTGAWCWGGNGYGGLGNGMMSGNAQIPSQVLTAASTNLTGATKVFDWFQAYKMCVLKSDASLWCWGSPSGLYAAPYIDDTSMPVTGITVVGRDCYLDANDKVWINGGTSTSYQVTCP